MSLIAAVLVLAATPAGLTLDIKSPETGVLVGEPVKLVVTWRATTTLREQIFPENNRFTENSLVVLVNDGGVERAYRECTREMVERVEAPVELKGGEEVVRSLVLLRGGCISGDGATGPHLFGTKGKYRVRAVYAKGRHRVESNAVDFTVSEPVGKEREVFAAIGRDLSMLDIGNDGTAQAAGKALIAQYPNSRYLRWARLQWIEHKGKLVNNRYDPDTGESMLHLDPASIRGSTLAKYRDLAEKIVEEGNWGPFDEDALVLAHKLARASRDEGVRQRIRGLLLEKYPASPAVKKINEDQAARDAEEAKQGEPGRP